MTSYNREDYIAEAIESILASTYSNFELIIVDDASSDETVKIAKKYERSDKRIKTYVNDENITQFPNRNKAASFAKGKYVKYMDSDDKIYDWGLEYCVGVMENYPRAGMGIFRAKNKVNEKYLSSKEAVNKHFFENSFLNIGPSGIILNRKAFEMAGYYNPNYGVPSDMYFNIKMASLFPVVLLEKEFFYYRTHKGQEINNRYSYLLNSYPYMRDILKFPELPLSNEKKAILLLKARKDFINGCITSIFRTGKIVPAYKAFKRSQMKLMDMISIIFR